MTTPITPEAVAAALILEPGDLPVEDGATCPTCGERFKVGEQILQVYAPKWMAAGPFRAVWDIHLRCYQGEEWPS